MGFDPSAAVARHAHNRNPHAHIDCSTRPFEREGTADWTFAVEKINGLADKAGLKSLRARISAAQRIRNDDQAENEAAALDPLVYNSILDDAPNRHVKTKHVGPLRGQMFQIDRSLGIEPD